MICFDIKPMGGGGGGGGDGVLLHEMFSSSKCFLFMILNKSNLARDLLVNPKQPFISHNKTFRIRNKIHENIKSTKAFMRFRIFEGQQELPVARTFLLSCFAISANKYLNLNTTACDVRKR